MKCQAHNELFTSAYFKKKYVIGSCRKDLCIGNNLFFLVRSEVPLRNKYFGWHLELYK